MLRLAPILFAVSLVQTVCAVDGAGGEKREILQLLAKKSALNSDSYQAAANSTDPKIREMGLRHWIEHRQVGGWIPDPSVLGNEPDPNARYVAVLALAHIPEGAPALAAIAVKDAADSRTREAVLQAIKGRELEFLGAFLQEVPAIGPNEAEIIRGVGRALPMKAGGSR